VGRSPASPKKTAPLFYILDFSIQLFPKLAPKKCSKLKEKGNEKFLVKKIF